MDFFNGFIKDALVFIFVLLSLGAIMVLYVMAKSRQYERDIRENEEIRFQCKKDV